MGFVSDLRIALRTLLRAPAFFAMAGGVLALGIAVVAVMFGFLRTTTTPPPLDRVDRVFALSVVDRKHNDPERWVALQDVEDWSREQKSFDAVAGLGQETISFRREGGSVERLLASRVTGPFFGLLRVQPLLGRSLVPEDNRPGASPVLVLSERLWRSTFNADPSVVGESVRVNGEVYAVVGVAPGALDLPVSAMLWFADRTDTSRDPQFLNGLGSPLPRMLAPAMFPIGRLKDGVTPEEGRAELRLIQARRTVKYPEVAYEEPDVRPLSILWMGGEYQRLVRVLLGSVALVLLLACVNVAGLLLVRGASRTHEAAVRRALGAGRFRLAGQMLAESVVVGAGAALAAMVLALAGMEVLRRVVPAVLPTAPAWWRMRLDGVSLLFTLGTALVAALGAGLVPAVRVSRVSVDPLLREGQRETGLHTTRLVRWLVVFEIALSSALLTAAGLVIRSGSRLGFGDVGVPTAGFLIAQIERPARYSFNSQREFLIALVTRLRAIPGVEAATVTTAPPGITCLWRPLYQLSDRSSDRKADLPSVTVVNVGPNYFETFAIPVQGRTFLDTDRDPRNTVGIVSESFARAAWPNESPIGRQLRVAPQEGWLPPVTIVGVAKDVRYDERLRSLGTRPLVMYVPVFQWPARWEYLVLRAPRDPMAAAEGIRQAVRQLDFEVPVFSVRALDEQRQRNAAGLTLIGRMFGAFGVLSLLLAASGVYGVVAYSVAQRTREIAIRRALGAPGGRVLLSVLARSGWQLALGLGLGVVLAPIMGAVVGSAVGQPDSAMQVYLGVALVLSAALLVSVLVPLRRALFMQPAAALRHT